MRRADTLLAIAIARLSGIRLVLLDRFDMLQPTARPQALKVLLALPAPATSIARSWPGR